MDFSKIDSSKDHFQTVYFTFLFFIFEAENTHPTIINIIIFSLVCQ
jgi:hypothetical protein